MPLTNREAFQLVLVLASVPLQIILSTHFSATVRERTHVVYKVAVELRKLRESFLNAARETFRQFVRWLVKGILKSDGSDMFVKQDHEKRKTAEGESESTAVEVLQYRERVSRNLRQQVRLVRPPYLRYRVGQVVRHKIYGYKAVIVGWDLRPTNMQAYTSLPGVWPGDSQNQSPHYRLLIDEQDQLSRGKHVGYVIQMQLEVLKNVKIQHKDLDQHFLYFDGDRYVPKDSLRKIYPKD